MSSLFKDFTPRAKYLLVERIQADRDLPTLKLWQAGVGPYIIRRGKGQVLRGVYPEQSYCEAKPRQPQIASSLTLLAMTGGGDSLIAMRGEGLRMIGGKVPVEGGED